MTHTATVIGLAQAEDGQVTGTAGASTQELEQVQLGNAREMAPSDARELSRHFFRRLQSLEEGTREYQYTRNTL
ncbi:RNA polymerase sigma factor SigF, partial [Streptomyces erythrochromogenes]